ncbi:Glycerate kinase [Trichinella patagoniensis]|uniref:Glycerate kinase n=1 Tax=Trichinella patagoniensis TaxID=990121 RepID=A0A0V0ZX41_9BILA|nr:Glycerate kinase [Trichinella patagoniensis]
MTLSLRPRRTQQLDPKEIALELFKAACECVNPEILVAENLIYKKNPDRIFIPSRHEHYVLNNNVYIVGFGKAAFGMCQKAAEIVDEHLVRGIASVPVGTMEQRLKSGPVKVHPRLEVYEGAKDNIPDESALRTSKRILNMVLPLKEDAIFISGGGSALFTCPMPTVNFDDKVKLIKQLSKMEITINLMNTLRRCLSLVKGGGLLKMAYPASVISLIISDVVNSDLEVIASGPTVPVSRNYEQVWNIIQRVRRNNKMPDDSIAKFLKSNLDVHESDVPRYRNVSNIIIGDNAKALNGLSEKAKQFGFTPIILTSKLTKQTSMFGSFLAELILRIFDFYRDNYCCDLFETYGITSGTFHHINDLIAKKPVCLLWGGETTPCVRGKGKGGRNMETILYFIKAVQTQMASMYMESLMSKQCVIASLGTDGQDGPTDAAGAMVSLNQLNLFDKSEVDKALLENDSYNYFQSVQNGDCLVKTGPTGTNVMNIALLLTLPSNEK